MEVQSCACVSVKSDTADDQECEYGLWVKCWRRRRRWLPMQCVCASWCLSVWIQLMPLVPTDCLQSIDTERFGEIRSHSIFGKRKAKFPFVKFQSTLHNARRTS